MDVNGTRFHLLLTQRDWLGAQPVPASVSKVRWNKDTGALELLDRLFVFPRPKKGAMDISARRGSGVDSFGNWYFIADSGSEIRFVPANGKASQHFWSPQDEVPPAPAGDFKQVPSPRPEVVLMAGAAVTTEHYLVVGTTTPKGLLIFDLYGGGAPSTIAFPDEVPFEPFDLAPTSCGGVLILDRHNRRYWKLNARFAVEPLNDLTPRTPREQDFHPVAGGAMYRSEDVQPRISVESSAPVTAVDPIAIEALPGHDVLILDNDAAAGHSVVHRFRGAEEIGKVALDATVMVLTEGDNVPSPPDPGAQERTIDSLLGYDFAFVGPDTLYVMSIEGEQVFAFRLTGADDLALELLPEYFPIRRFGGKALVTFGTSAYYDFGERWLPVVEQPRPRYEESATIQLPPGGGKFDGKEPDCVWHRLFLDACIPPGAQVQVQSRAANSQAQLESATWRSEPALLLRDDGSEMPFYKPAIQGAADRTGTFELLFQSAHGRYCQLQLTLQGTGRNTPRLQALRVYYPRFSYLKNYLPALYRQDPTSSSFLDRFLANPEGIYTKLEGQIEQAQEMFDWRTTNAEYLDWLASWLGATLDISWSEQTRRMFIEHAPELFPQRGTLTGILRMLHLGLDAQPAETIFQSCSCGSGQPAGSGLPGFDIRIVESFLTRGVSGVAAGDISDASGPGITFSKGWKPAQGVGALDDAFHTWLSGRYANVAALNSAWGTAFAGFDDPFLRVPAVEPDNPAQASDWLLFISSELGFKYIEVTSADLPLYREFLARKYRQASDLNTAYSLTPPGTLANFSDVDTKLWTQLRTGLPQNTAWLSDWITFVTLALPISRQAHRFTVLVPVAVTDSLQIQIRRLQLAQRIAEAEKPAHTSADVRLFWAMFRVGEARLGQDTILGNSSRFVALQLGASYLGGSYLGYGPPWDVTSRMVVGRDRLQTQEQIV